MYYIGLDVHKKTISYCIKRVSGEVHAAGTIDATRSALDLWLTTLPQPWTAALEATIFTGWIYDHLKPHASAVKVAHPFMLRAIAASKKKNDQVDARKIADLLRCDLLPECYMAPSEFRERRRTLRYRNLLVRQGTQMKNRMAGLLMETGVAYNRRKLHKKGYFTQLRDSAEVPDCIQPLLKIGRESVERIARLDRTLLRTLERDPELAARVERLQTIPGVGPVTALTWALEVGEVSRFPSLKHAVSYCGLCSAERSSGGVQRRSPISKQRNKHLQPVLIEAAKTRAAMERRSGPAARKGAPERKPQSGHARGGPQARGVLIGGRSPR